MLFPCPSFCSTAAKWASTTWQLHTSHPGSLLGLAPEPGEIQGHICHWWGAASSCLPPCTSLALMAGSLTDALDPTGSGFPLFCDGQGNLYKWLVIGRRSSGVRGTVVLALKISSWAVEFVFSVSAEGFPSGPCIRAFSAFSQVDRRIRLLIKPINKVRKLLEWSRCTVKQKSSD